MIVACFESISITHAAITDQAGLSHINTESFKQEEVQNQLNPIITNDFNQAQAHKELNAQVTITTEFSKEAPKAVAEFADKQAFKLIQNLNELNDKNIDITSDEYQNTIKEIDKWSEGGIYRVALHTAVAALATGTVEGAASAGGTAYAIPKIDEYLKEQGFDETARHSALLALSAGIGATVGGDTASTVNNVGQVEWNYLSHQENERVRELRKEKSRLSNAYGNCVSQRCAEITREIQELENLSKQRDKAFDAAYANCLAGKDCHRFYYLHVTQRNEWNKEGVDLFKRDLLDGNVGGDWIPQDHSKNMFHNFSQDGKRILTNPDGTYRNTKYVHKNGQFEVIVDENGRIVTNPNSYRTYNYYPADYNFGILHKDYDVDPWADFGNGNGDNTTYETRRQDMISKIFGEFKFWDNRENAIKNFNEVDKKKK